MIYAKAHDQTVAEGYFSAMQKVEERLQIGEEKELSTLLQSFRKPNSRKKASKKK